MTRQERLALGTLGLLIAAGAAGRTVRRAEPVAWNRADSAAAVPAELSERTRRLIRSDSAAAVPLAPGERIDPNRASAEELRRLPRVSAALAERIVAYRGARGPFRSLADLDSVSGIGPATLARIAPSITLPASAPTSAAASSAAVPQPAATGATVVDVNRASAAELDALPGIGPVLAARIVERRTSAGPFRTADDLLAVPGIGPRTLERIRAQVRVAP